jgi:hypothetical protein
MILDWMEIADGSVATRASNRQSPEEVEPSACLNNPGPL